MNLNKTWKNENCCLHRYKKDVQSRLDLRENYVVGLNRDQAILFVKDQRKDWKDVIFLKSIIKYIISQALH